MASLRRDFSTIVALYFQQNIRARELLWKNPNENFHVFLFKNSKTLLMIKGLWNSRIDFIDFHHFKKRLWGNMLSIRRRIYKRKKEKSTQEPIHIVNHKKNTGHNVFVIRSIKIRHSNVFLIQIVFYALFIIFGTEVTIWGHNCSFGF